MKISRTWKWWKTSSQAPHKAVAFLVKKTRISAIVQVEDATSFARIRGGKLPGRNKAEGG